MSLYLLTSLKISNYLLSDSFPFHTFLLIKIIFSKRKMRNTLNGKLIAISYSRDGMKGNFPLIKMRDQLKVKEKVCK